MNKLATLLILPLLLAACGYKGPLYHSEEKERAYRGELVNKAKEAGVEVKADKAKEEKPPTPRPIYFDKLNGDRID